MQTARLNIELSQGEPPREFLVFKAGDNTSTKGTFKFTEKSAKGVISKSQAHGTRISVDYDHAMLNPLPIDPAESGKAAGWCGLEVRSGALWAVQVEWTPKAAHKLRDREFRYISPAFCHDAGEVTELINVALTNIPALDGQQPLIAHLHGRPPAASAEARSDAFLKLTESQRETASRLGLSFEEMHAAQLAGVDPARMAETKRRHAARG